MMMGFTISGQSAEQENAGANVQGIDGAKFRPRRGRRNVAPGERSEPGVNVQRKPSPQTGAKEGNGIYPDISVTLARFSG